MPINLVVIGAGGHAQSILDTLTDLSTYRMLGFLDSTKPKDELVSGYPVLGALDDIADLYGNEPFQAVVAIGDNYQRQRITVQATAHCPDLKFAKLIHPQAMVSRTAEIGEGAIILRGAAVNRGCVIGDGALVNTKASLDHGVSLAAFASVAPGVIVGGDVTIGERSFIGIGSTLVHDISIARDVCVGAGSLVLTSVTDDLVTVFGHPASPVRARRVDEPYL